MTQIISRANQTENGQQHTLSVSQSTTKPQTVKLEQQIWKQRIADKFIELAKHQYLRFSRLNHSKPDIATSRANIYVANYINAEATVVETIFPNKKGRIKLFDIYWPAKIHSYITTAIAPGEIVYVIDRDGINLIVQPLTMKKS